MRRLALALAAFATAAAVALPPATPVETISFETGPCFGACPVYRVHVNSDGSGVFEGIRFTAVTGLHSFRVTRRQYRAFAAHLAPVRPAHGDLRYSGAPLCRRMATDLAAAEVTWRSRAGEQRLYVYYGCDMEQNRALIDRLAAAPALLPIGDYIRPRR